MPTAPTLRTPTGSDTPPTTLQGYSDYSVWGFSLTDVLEHVPSLIWPASITVYAEMRRDPQLAAVLAGITLPIRRATWTVDPTGCRPEVVQMVADDLGLPVAGKDTPGAARVRGVSWSEHLRSALLHLVFGFYGFELLADVSSGQARLVGLYERVPATIAFIHSTATGDFGGISQILRPGNNPETPEIPADRMVWYTHEREGAAHHGTSILRPGYSSWLMKQTLRRVLAVSNERFGTGVPTVEWAPGFIPTPEQMTAAQQAASAARVGSTAGVAMPPGARLVLTGLSGGVPNTIEALRWVDQQMSGMVLSRWMDLGSSQTGSRALGEAFIDTFLLSLQTLADAIGDVATRQIAARVVAWNWGDDEPVPRVMAADVGSRHEVTADALHALMQSGALSGDPQLEEWVRRTYRLPPRDPNTPWVPMVPTAQGRPHPAVTPPDVSPVAAAAPRRPARRRKQPDGQLELPIAAAADTPPRDLTVDELAAGVDFAQLQADHDAATAALVAALPVLLAPIAASLTAGVAAALASDGVAALGALTPDAAAVSALGDAIAGQAVKLAGKAAKQATKEAKGIGLPVSGVTVDKAALADQAQATAQLIASGMAQSASRTALLHAGPGVAADVVTAAVQADLDSIVVDERNWITGSLSSVMSAAQHAGRMAAFQTLADTHGADAATWVASEVNDHGVCAPCHEIDGKRFASFEEAVAAYPTGRYIACLGRDRCRGTLFAVAK